MMDPKALGDHRKEICSAIRAKIRDRELYIDVIVALGNLGDPGDARVFRKCTPSR